MIDNDFSTDNDNDNDIMEIGSQDSDGSSSLDLSLKRVTSGFVENA
jgi:hypothetical protein